MMEVDRVTGAYGVVGFLWGRKRLLSGIVVGAKVERGTRSAVGERRSRWCGVEGRKER